MIKRFAWFILILLVLVLPLVFAVEIEMNSEFDQGETFLAVASGNFLDKITRENVFFYQDHVRIPLFYEVKEIDGDFYIYALLTGKGHGNYSIVIKNVRYMGGPDISEEEIVKNFTITEEIADFYVNPGFLIISNDFFLEVQSLQDKKITLSIKTPKIFISNSSIELKSGELKKINFELNTEESALGRIELISENTRYFVPVFFDTQEKIKEPEKVEFKFEPGKANVSIATNSDSKKIIYILNLGSEAKNISVYASPSLEPYISISPSTISSLSKDDAMKIEISIASNSEEMVLEGRINAETENFTTSFTLILSFIKDYIPEIKDDNETGNEMILTSCTQLEGIICLQGEKCSGNSLPTKEGVCCFAECEAPPKSNTGKIIGWGLLVVLVIFLFWFFKKYKRIRPKVDLLKIGRGKK